MWCGGWRCTPQVACSSTAPHGTRTPRASPPPLAELSSRIVSLPVSNSEPFSIPRLAGRHRSPSHPSYSHLPRLNSPNPFGVSSDSSSVSPTTPPLSFGPVSSCKTSGFGCEGQNSPCCSTHGSYTKVSVLFSTLFLINLPFSLLLGIASRCCQGAPCGCKILSVWLLLISSPLPSTAWVSFLLELFCVFWDGLRVPYYLSASHQFDFFCRFSCSLSDLNILNRCALLPQLSPSLLGVTNMLMSLGLCLNPWASDDELFHHKNWTSIPSFYFLSFKLFINPQDCTIAL